MTATRLSTYRAAPDAWMQEAACKDTVGDLFFPVVHTKGWQEQMERAKQVCARCPVRPECLAYALDTGQKAGVWGGLSEAERQELRELPETHAERCWNSRAWIEARLAEGVQQREIADRLRVTRRTLCRVIGEFKSECEPTAQLDAASEAVNAA